MVYGTRLFILENFVVSKAEMAAKVLENEIISCWKRARFNVERTVELVDLPVTERLVLSSN